MQNAFVQSMNIPPVYSFFFFCQCQTAKMHKKPLSQIAAILIFMHHAILSHNKSRKFFRYTNFPFYVNIVLKIKTERSAAKMKLSTPKRTILQCAFLLAAALMIVCGINRGEQETVWNKAANICPECIGLG